MYSVHLGRKTQRRPSFYQIIGRDALKRALVGIGEGTHGRTVCSVGAHLIRMQLAIEELRRVTQSGVGVAGLEASLGVGAGGLSSRPKETHSNSPGPGELH